MKKTTYNCKQNDAVIRVLSDNGDIQELWVKIKGETTWTIIGYNDLLKAIDKAHRKAKLKDSHSYGGGYIGEALFNLED